MKKDVQEAIQFAMNNTILLADKVNELVDKVAELEDILAFYGSSTNQLEMTVKRLSHDFHEEQRIEPYIVNNNQTNWFDDLAIEKKVREDIIAKLEKQQNANSCACGDICQAYDNGFQDAINTIRDM